MLRFPATLILLIALTACAGGEAARPQIEPAGPPSLRPEVIERHAAEFAGDLADRAAGTEGEHAASAYILGHLQQAGYVVLLDSVPLADLVRSTNVVARPPSGGPPEVVVAVPYDAPTARDRARREGEAVALMIELARALRVVEPEHSVEFVALGAEHADEVGGRLGSRRLAQTLLDAGTTPLVLTVRFDLAVRSFRTWGDTPRGLLDAARAVGVEQPAGDSLGAGALKEAEIEDDVFRQAGFEFVVVSGRRLEVGDVLLGWLAAEAG